MLSSPAADDDRRQVQGSLGAAARGAGLGGVLGPEGENNN